MANVCMIALWGSGGAGKTLLSAKLARELAGKGKEVMLLVCDDETPGQPLLLRYQNANGLSLGELLALPSLSQADVLRYSCPFNGNERISLMGYLMGERGNSYAAYSASRVRELFAHLRSLADFVIVDCPTTLESNMLGPIALSSAERVIRVGNADIRSNLYFNSQKLLLQDEQFHWGAHIGVLNAVRPNQGISPFEADMGGKPIVFPYSEDLKEQYDSRCLQDALFGREAKRFNIAMQTLVGEVTKDGAQ